MSDFSLYENIGPVFRAESEIFAPVIGSTTQFLLRVTRDNEPVNDAIVTLQVKNYEGQVVYPTSGSGTQIVPLSSKYPGTYVIVPQSTSIFSTSQHYYTVLWNVSTLANANYPASVLPMTQKILPMEP